jgi:integrase/recombinase XerD
MTLLRQQLIDEIQLRGFSPNTQDSYVRSVAGLAQFFHRSPDQIGDQEIKTYLLHLLRVKKLAVSSIIVAVSALRFFFGQVLHRPTQAIEQALPTMKKPILRPRVYSEPQLVQLFGYPELNPKHRALFMTAYAAGPRVSELCHLRIADLLSDRCQIHVVRGKGRNYAKVMVMQRNLTGGLIRWGASVANFT